MDNKAATLDSNFEIKEDKNATLSGAFEKKEEMEIVQLIRQNSSITQKKLQKKTGISLGTIKRILSRLQAKGVFGREGGKWIIKITNNNGEKEASKTKEETRGLHEADMKEVLLVKLI